MSGGKGSQKRHQADAKRVAKMRREGLSLKEISVNTGIAREKLRNLIALGERLLSLDENRESCTSDHQ